MSIKNPKIHLWVPDLFSFTGGIQTFCQHFIQGMTAIQPAQNMRVLVKNDSVEILQQQHLSYQANGYGNWNVPFRTLLYGLSCLWYALRERPGLVICMHLHFSPLAKWMSALFGIPYVLLVYGIEAWYCKSKLQNQALRAAHLVLAISQHTRNWLIEQAGISPNRVELLAPTYSGSQFSISNRPQRLAELYGVVPQTSVILTVCRLAEEERYKGYDQIIKAMPKIVSQVPDVRYVLVGKGPDRDRILRLIEQNGVRKYVTLAGFVPDEELPDYYNFCDVFAMPSKEEGFGIVYLEALSCGKPVLAGYKDGSRDALAGGELGVLIDPDNVDEIADSLVQILQKRHPHPLIFQPEQLRERVIERFGVDTFRANLRQRLAPFLTQR